MPDSAEASSDSGVGDRVDASLRRQRWQFGLHTLILLIVTIAVWLSHVVNRREITALEARIKVMRPMVPELVIDDPRQIAVVKLEEHWFDENRWEIFLPAGDYRLSVATHDVDEQGTAPTVASAPLQAGRQLIELEQKRTDRGWQVAVTLNGNPALTVDEPAQWDPATGSSGGSNVSRCTQEPPDRPLELFRRRFMSPPDAKGTSRTPAGPTNGILLWIEPTSAPAARP